MEEKAIKGSMVIDVVKAIRNLKSIPWENHLTEDAQKLVSQRILHSVWYPYEAFLSCLIAVYEVAGGKNPDIAKSWGNANGRAMFEKVYSHAFSEKHNIMRTLEKFGIISKNFFRGLNLESRQLGEKHAAIIGIDDDPRTEPIYYFIQGWIEAIFEISEVTKYQIKFVEKHWAGGRKTVMEFKWE